MAHITINGESWCVSQYRKIIKPGLPDINQEHRGGRIIRCETLSPIEDVARLREFYMEYPELQFEYAEGDCPHKGEGEDWEW